MVVAKYTELVSEQEWTRLKEDLALPPRQAEVVRCLLGGMSDKQIADATGISINTVRTHLSRLFGKLSANDRVELILCLFEHVRRYHLQEDRVLV